MVNRPLFDRSFWSSKLGLAACVSTAAMIAMVIATTGFDTGHVQASVLMPPFTDTVASIGLA